MLKLSPLEKMRGYFPDAPLEMTLTGASMVSEVRL